MKVTLKGQQKEVLEVIKHGRPMKLIDIANQLKHIEYTRVHAVLTSLCKAEMITKTLPGVYRLGMHKSANPTTKADQLIKLLEGSDLPMTRAQILKHFDKKDHQTIRSALSIKVSRDELSLLDKDLYTSAGYGDYRYGEESVFCYKALNDFLSQQASEKAKGVLRCMWSNRNKPMSIAQVAKEAGTSVSIVYRLRHELIGKGWRFVNLGTSSTGKLYSMNRMIKK
ncbi:winged helix-turn-helix DNA-binding domain protein [Vibrio phage 1.167.O._10N.261.51.F2]|nr:winged helix-turn-helix DNA-binding domain protein [Vibrio phage 1.167.O._10N.261.51.F2]